MSRDPYYSSKAWRALRLLALDRDLWRCTAPGCREQARFVDHIIRRRDGGPDTLENLRSLCAYHDNQVKEQADGKRRHGGRLHAVGCDAQGRPLDQGHWWNAPAQNLAREAARNEPQTRREDSSPTRRQEGR